MEEDGITYILLGPMVEVQSKNVIAIWSDLVTLLEIYIWNAIKILLIETAKSPVNFLWDGRFGAIS